MCAEGWPENKKQKMNVLRLSLPANRFRREHIIFLFVFLWPGLVAERLLGKYDGLGKGLFSFIFKKKMTKPLEAHRFPTNRSGLRPAVIFTKN